MGSDQAPESILQMQDAEFPARPFCRQNGVSIRANRPNKVKMPLRGIKSSQISINSGFFKKLYCFFSEYPENESSLFAVFRKIQTIFLREELNGW